MSIRHTAAALAILAVASCSPSPAADSPGSAADSPTSPPAEQPALATTKCADLIVLGARGYTQSWTKNFGSGTEVRRSVTAMAHRLHDRSDSTVRLEGVPYPADSLSAYTDNVLTGVANMRKIFTKLAESCPDSRFGMVGFSQGAQIVHGFAVDLTPNQIERIALVAMISDPRKNPDDDFAHFSYADSPTPGPGKLGAGTPLPQGLRSAAISFCVKDDEICNWPSGGYPGPLSDTHRHYYEIPGHARQTGEQLAKILENNGF